MKASNVKQILIRDYGLPESVAMQVLASNLAGVYTDTPEKEALFLVVIAHAVERFVYAPENWEVWLATAQGKIASGMLVDADDLIPIMEGMVEAKHHALASWKRLGVHYTKRYGLPLPDADLSEGVFGLERKGAELMLELGLIETGLLNTQ